MTARLRRWFGVACAAYVRTWRVRLTTPEGRTMRVEDLRGADVAVACERDLFAIMGIAAARALVLVAPGRDGDWASAVAEALGCETVRGSARHRPAAALRELARRTRPDRPVLIVADGPLGPANVVKPGALAPAVLTGRGVRPFTCAAAWAVRVPRTWSGIYLPLPYSRVEVMAGEVMAVGAAADRAGRRACADALGATLAQMRTRAWSTTP